MKLATAVLILGGGSAALAATRHPLSQLSVAETRNLLAEWNLDHAFGNEFEKYQVGGRALSVYQPGDLTPDLFPNAEKLHWRQLHHELAEYSKQLQQQGEGTDLGLSVETATAADGTVSRRKLASPKGFAGLTIQKNQSMVSFGEVGDVKLQRTGEGELTLLGNLLLQALSDKTGSDIIDVRETLDVLLAIAEGNPPPGMCFSSCKQAKDNYPKASSGVYCVNVASGATADLYCDMDSLGGGWTYVARGTDSSDGCGTSEYGDVVSDINDNSRWSLGQDVINKIGGDGYDYLEYYVAIGHNNDNEYDSHDQFRIYRVPASPGLSLSEPMDSSYNIQVWSGEYWVPGQFQCNPADCGPCWEPGRENFCCEGNMTSTDDCHLASLDQEGQWSHSNTNQHLRCDVSDYDQDQLVLYVRGGNGLGRECFSSCYSAKQLHPDAPSGKYCIIVGGQDDNRQELYCDMDTMGGGWTYVARGTNSNDGCDTDAFGDVTADHWINTRWSLGDWAINEIGYDNGNQWLEYYVTMGHDNDAGLEPHEYARVMRTPLGSNFTLGSGMDKDYNVEVWSGSSWVAMQAGCNSGDCGPCWEPDYQNWCCEMDQSGVFIDCPEAGRDQEGQWSHTNTNQHLRCMDNDYDQDSLVLFVR